MRVRSGRRRQVGRTSLTVTVELIPSLLCHWDCFFVFFHDLSASTQSCLNVQRNRRISWLQQPPVVNVNVDGLSFFLSLEIEKKTLAWMPNEQKNGGEITQWKRDSYFCRDEVECFFLN